LLKDWAAGTAKSRNDLTKAANSREYISLFDGFDSAAVIRDFRNPSSPNLG